MASSRTSSAARAAMIAVGAAMLYGCSGGLSCGGGSSCLNGYAYPQTQAQVPNGVQAVDDGVRLRMTQAALDFLSEHMKEILLGALGEDPNNPGYVRLEIPGQQTIIDGTVTVTLGEGPNEQYPTAILIDANELASRLTFTFQEGADEGIRLRAVDVPVGLDARIFTEVDFGFTATAACQIDGTNPDYGPGIFTGITLDILVRPDVGTGAQCDLGQGQCLLIEVDVLDAQLGDFGANSIEITSPPRCTSGSDGTGPCSEECSDTVAFVDNNGDRECTSFCPVYDFGVDLVAGIAGFIEPLIESFLDDLLDVAIRQALADVDGSPLSASNRLDLAAFAPGLLSSTTLDLGYSIQPTGNAFDVNCPAGNCGETRGMDIILSSGFEAAPDPTGQVPVPHPCALPYRGADFNALYGTTSGELETEGAQALTGELGGTTYHLGASLAEPAINQMLFGAYNAGALCLELTTEGVHALTGGAFQLSAGTIDLLTGGKLRQFAQPTAPAVVAINPIQPPIVTYGAGTLDEGHIAVDWPEVEVSFYVLMYERYARIFGVAANVSMQLSVFNDPETRTLHISVVDGPTVDGFETKYNELLPDVDFTGVLESLLGLAFDTALGDGLEFDYDVGNALADQLGIPVYIDFRGIETVPETNREFLNVYLTLTDEPPQPFSAPLPPIVVDDEAGLYTVADPSAPRAQHVLPTGEVRIVGDVSSGGAPLDHGSEYFALVDFGAWKGPFRTGDDGALVVRDPKLSLVGQHVVKLRGRLIGEPNSLVPYDEAVDVVVWTDPEAPKVSLTIDGEAVRAHGVDVGTAPGLLQWAWRTDDGEWTDFGDAPSLPLDDVAGRRVSARAKDLAGNVSQPATLDVAAARAALAKRGVVLGEDGGCASPSSSTIGALALLALAARRRRR